MTELDPTRLIEDCRRITCPMPGCGEQVLREETHGTPAVRRLRAFCSGLDCKWMQHVEVPRDGGEARTYTPDRPQPRQGWDALQALRPRCAVPGCAKLAAEGGLCEAHASLWRADGRQPLDAWTEAQGEREAASRERGTFRFPADGGGDPAAEQPAPQPPPPALVEPAQPIPGETDKETAMTAAATESQRRSEGIRFGKCRKITPGLTREHWEAAGKPSAKEWAAKHTPASEPKLSLQQRRTPTQGKRRTAAKRIPPTPASIIPQLPDAPKFTLLAGEPLKLPERVRVVAIEVDGEIGGDTLASLVDRIKALFDR